MSVFIHTRGEAGGGVAAHLRCTHCGHFSKSHAQQLAHLAASHPACLDDVAVGRLGNILMYQSSGRLFHCSECFHTCRDFTKLYKHIIARHCMVDKEAGGGGGEEDQEGEEEAPEKRRSEEVKGGKDASKEEDEEKIEGSKRKRSSKEDNGPESKKSCQDAGKEEDGEKEAPGNNQSLQGKEEKEGKRSSEAEEEQNKAPADVKPGDEEKKYVLTFDGVLFHCKICGWSHRQRSVSVSHIVRKHEIPKTYATHALAKSRELQTGRAEEDDGAGMSEELMREEMDVAAKWVGFVSHRFVCLVCNWRSKLKGFVLTHIERHHEVERPYSCRDCSQSFFLPSRLQQHVRTAHRPGRYACPFCWFRSEFLGGFRRHCSRCNAREEEEGGAPGGGEGREQEEEVEKEPEERKETRGMRRRRSLGRRVEEEEQEDEDD